MAKACGLRIGPRRFELFVLEGSAKKTKIITSLAGEIPPDEDDPLGAAGHALKAAIKAHKIPVDNVALVIDASSAAYRDIGLPVVGATKIDSVLKFEVESKLPQFNIDEVIIDYLVKDTMENSSSLLVTAVPKEKISHGIAICNAGGFDPLEVEVETSALVNAAASCGLLVSEEAQVLVHIGEESTAVAVVDSGTVREMRVIQTGALTYTPYGVIPSDDDVEEEAPDADGEWEGGSAGPPEIGRRGEVVQRIRRELARTISAARTVSELRTIYVSGFSLPGMLDEDILGVPVVAMEGFDLEIFEGNVHDEYVSGSIAYGAAVRQLGGGLVQASLRREELKFSGAMERLELPLAVMGLLITTLLGVWFMFLQKERQSIDYDLRFMLDSSVNYMMGDGKSGAAGNLEYPSDEIKNYVAKYTGRVPGAKPTKYRSDPNRNLYEQLTFLRNTLRNDERELQKHLGHDNELVQPQSALKGLTLVLDMIAQSDGKYGRVAFHSIKANYRAASNRKTDEVLVTLELAFFAESTTEGSRNYESFFNDISDETVHPWYVDHDYSRSDPITGAESGVFLPSVTIHVDVSKAAEVKS
ncbi:MAG: hypothetical protein ACI8X5_002939 [Planctomycetota bacterium]|jgi:hypothetical protein